MNKGHALKPGDTIGIIAPASPPKTIDSVHKAKAELEALGFKVVLGRTCYESYGGYMAGTPEQRAAELNEMFADPDVDAVMALRGGYGSPQILHLLDYDMIAQNPKLFIGYSDITALHTALRQEAGLATLHGPNASPGLLSGTNAYTRECLLRAMTSTEPLGEIVNPPGEEIVCLVEGEACGEIVGGNLSLVAALAGTPYQVDAKGKLLFLEDVDEEPYRVDRMLTQLALVGTFAECAGIILGTWNNCTSKKQDSFTVLDVISNMIAPYQKPMIWNLQAGHGENNAALPFGVQAYLDATGCRLIVEEAVVR